MGKNEHKRHNFRIGIDLVGNVQPTKNVQKFTPGQQLLLIWPILDNPWRNDFGCKELSLLPADHLELKWLWDSFN